MRILGFFSHYEKFGDTNEEIRSHKMKDRQYNGQMKDDEQ
jgi:hypothetical protein